MDDRYVFFGWMAIAVGLLQSALCLFEYFFIDFYSSIGIKGWFSSFCLSILLIVAGYFMIKKNEKGFVALNGYLAGVLIDRIMVYFLYFEQVHFFSLILPMVFAMPFWLFLFQAKEFRFLDVKFIPNNLLFFIILLGVIIAPKIL